MAGKGLTTSRCVGAPRKTTALTAQNSSELQGSSLLTWWQREAALEYAPISSEDNGSRKQKSGLSAVDWEPKHQYRQKALPSLHPRNPGSCSTFQKDPLDAASLGDNSSPVDRRCASTVFCVICQTSIQYSALSDISWSHRCRRPPLFRRKFGGPRLVPERDER